MQPIQDAPLHWDSNRRSTNLTFIFALAVAAFGVYGLFTQGEWLVLIMGLAVAGYSWLTTAKHYMIFPGALVIIFGTPRRKVIPFDQVSHVEFLSLPTMGDRLRVRLVNGRTVMLQARDSETFHERLEDALNQFHATSPSTYIEGERSSTEEE